MKIYIGSDHAGYLLKEEIVKYLNDKYEVVNCGPFGMDSVDYPDYAVKVCKEVKEDVVGILVCYTGIGMSMAANKFKGVRAALCNDPFAAKMTRLHNDANVLALGGGMIGKNMAIDILETFLNTEFSEGENHIRRISLIEQG